MLSCSKHCRTDSSVDWTNVECERQMAQKRRLVLDFYLKFIEASQLAFNNDLSPGEVALFSVISLNQDEGIETYAKLIPDYLGFSPATMSRKLNGLVNRGYLNKTLKSGVYYYTINERYRTRYSVCDCGVPITSNLFESMIDAVSEVARG